MESLEAKLRRAWESKVNLQTEDCLALVTELKQALGIPAGPLTPSQIEALSAGPNALQVLDTLLLSASLARSMGDLAFSETLLKQLDATLGRSGIPGFHRLSYERGMAAFMRGDFSVALEEFLRGSLQAKEDLPKLWALINALFCMENLALPHEKALRQVEELVGRLRTQMDLARVECQLKAFGLRRLFREGRIRELLGTEDQRPVEKYDQGKYFALWVRLLPYHTGFREITPDELEKLNHGQSYQHYRSYRMRTAQGILHPEDLAILKPSEFVDRLYIWVWRWLRDPANFPAQRLLALFRDLKLAEKAHQFTAEDRQLLRNSLLWLSLFDPACDRRLAELLASIQGPFGSDYPILRLEYLLVHYLAALRDRNSVLIQDYRIALEDHPLWTQPDLHFRAIGDALAGKSSEPVPPTIAPLVSNLRDLLHTGTVPGGQIVVDLSRCEILDVKAGRKIVSEPMCAALDLLRNEGTVSCEHFALACFNLRVFDSLIHNGKIFNLLSRLKKLTGNNPTFRMKSGFVLAEGSWDAIYVRKAALSPSQIRSSPEWKSLLYGGAGSPQNPAPAPVQLNPAELLARIRWSDAMSRRELERRIGRPRSTTNRILKQWLDSGLILRKGKSKSTRYFLRAPSKKSEEREAIA